MLHVVAHVQDNVTVVIIDLKAPKPTGSDMEAASACGTSTPESTCCELRASEVHSASHSPGVYTGTSLLSPQLTVLEGALPPCPLPVDAHELPSNMVAQDVQKAPAAVASAVQVVANVGFSAFSAQQSTACTGGPDAGSRSSNIVNVQQQPLHHTPEEGAAHAQAN
jgi:hypothetical protein